MLIIGLGTGRCGTKSLTRLLAAQGIEAEHERKPALSWIGESNPGRHVRQGLATAAWADVGFYYLPYIRRLMREFPGIRCICLRRDRAETIESFCRVGKPEWFTTNADGWPKCFPTYESASMRELAARYWDEYYAAAREFECERFRIFDTESLNSELGIGRMLGFVGITDPAIEFVRVTD